MGRCVTRTSGTGKSDVGKHRTNNEDAFLLDDELGLYVVCDGMGGHASGEVASKMAVKAVEQALTLERPRLEKVRDGEAPAEELAKLVTQAVQSACGRVYEEATSRPELAGMGCTLTMLLFAGGKAILGHVGDTRAYLCRDGEANQISVDHTMAGELVRAGVVAPEDVHRHPQAHILTRAIGSQRSVRVDTLVVDVLPGDRYLLCSDGLSNYVEDLAWLAGQLQAESVDAAPEALVKFANEAGGKDNVTVVVVAVEGDEAEVSGLEELKAKLGASSSVFLLENLSLEQITRVLQVCTLRSFGADAGIVRQGETVGSLSWVLQGAVALTRDGKESRLGPGDYFGETTLLRPRRCRATVRALEPTRLLTLEGEALSTLSSKRPWLGVALLERLGRRLSVGLDRAGGGEAGGFPARGSLF